ncbi:MAG: GYD domain-containing protein [Mycobacteriales bacterium]
MAHYLIEVGYTPQSWNTQIDTHPNVVDRITPALDACGAKLQCVYYAFGDVDLVAIIDFKNAEDAAAFGLAVTSSGALRTYKTTPLLSVDQGLDSMKKAAKLRKVYSPPLTVSLVDQPARAR